MDAQGFLPVSAHRNWTTGKDNLLLSICTNICWEAVVILSFVWRTGEWISAELLPSGFRLDWVTSLASSRWKDKVGDTCKRSKNGSRLFYFSAAWELGQRYCSSVGFFGWTNIILKIYLWVFKALKLPGNKSFFQCFFYNSALFCAFLELFAMWSEDESADSM